MAACGHDYSSPPKSVDEFAEFCARMTRRYTGQDVVLRSEFR